MQIGQMAPWQTQLAILLVSCAIIAWFYPEYTGIVIPLFVAITLYFSSDEMIISMFSIIPIDMSNVTGIIIKYKMYIMIALAVLSAYYASQLFSKKNGHTEDLTDLSTDLFGSTVSSTRYSAPKSSNGSSDMDIMDMIKAKSSPKMIKKSSKMIKQSGLDLDDSM